MSAKGQLIEASKLLFAMQIGAELLVFFGAIFLIWRIWAMCIAYITRSDEKKAALLTALIGTAEVGVGNAKAIGTGLGISVAILLLAVAAMWVIAGGNIADIFGPAMQQAQQ